MLIAEMTTEIAHVDVDTKPDPENVLLRCKYIII